MNSSGFEIRVDANLVTKKNELDTTNPSILLDSDQNAHTIITHKIHSHLEEDISDFVFHILQTIARNCDNEISWDKHQKLVKLSGTIVKDFEHFHYKRGFFAKVFDKMMVTLKLRHSEQEIRILHRSIKAPTLGDKISPEQADLLVDLHRNPLTNSEAYDQVALTGVFFENRFKEVLVQNADAIKQLKEPQLSIFKAHLKEQVVKEVYQAELPKRVQEGCYNPAIIPHEINKLLGPVIKVSRLKLNKDNLNNHLQAEVQRYAKHLTEHQLNYIETDVIETMKLYLKAFPQRSSKDAFVLGRDLIRFAVYQEIFDKASFSGSDHGSKHIHHNIENAESLHTNMKLKVDYSDKDKFIERMIHFFHDVGYTVGLSSKSFSCCKDHPLIGAKMIEENRNYFEHYLDKESLDILWNGVLLHAIALPNLSPDAQKVSGMYPGMVRAVTSISDACAVTYDRKTQEFWEQPTAIVALARLRLFLTKYPQYIAKLAPLGKDEWDQLDKENPLDVLAHDVFQNTKRILLKAVDKSDVPPQKKELFRQAIFQQFNSFTTTTTLGQYGGVLVGVSSVRNEESTDKDAPKFYPQFDLAPSLIYGTLRDLFGADIAQSSFKKLVDEFNGDVGVLAKEINLIAQKNVSHQAFSPKPIKTGNARFRIVEHHDIEPHNKHLEEMQRTLHRVIEKVDTISRTQYMPLIEKNRVLEALTKFRQRKLNECSSFSDFITEYVLPNLNTNQSAGTIKDIQKLTQAVNKDLFVQINSADDVWENIFKVFEDACPLIKTEIEKFKLDIEKNKIALLDKKGTAKFSDLVAGFKKNIIDSGKIDVSNFETSLNQAISQIQSQAARFIKAEQQFISIINAVKFALISEEEYRFMRGKHTPITKAECLEKICSLS